MKGNTYFGVFSLFLLVVTKKLHRTPGLVFIFTNRMAIKTGI